MKTTKPISTISYNSAGFLIGVLKRLEENGQVAFWAFIKHDAEEDENKDHYHVYIEPSNSIETNWLKKQFLEVDPTHPTQPLGVLPIQKSKFGDWYWYILHDPAYLASKGQSRKYHYDPSEVITSDVEALAEYVRTNPNPKAELVKVTELIIQGYTPLQIALNMNVPTRNLKYFLEGVHILEENTRQITNRNGKEGHEIALTPEDKNDENH